VKVLTQQLLSLKMLPRQMGSLKLLQLLWTRVFQALQWFKFHGIRPKITPQADLPTTKSRSFITRFTATHLVLQSSLITVTELIPRLLMRQSALYLLKHSVTTHSTYQ
jgi:hypothetical protein